MQRIWNNLLVGALSSGFKAICLLCCWLQDVCWFIQSIPFGFVIVFFGEQAKKGVLNSFHCKGTADFIRLPTHMSLAAASCEKGCIVLSHAFSPTNSHLFPSDAAWFFPFGCGSNSLLLVASISSD